MFLESKNGLLIEQDAALAAAFHSAGFGFREGNGFLFHPLEAAYLLKIGKAGFSGGLGKFLSLQKKKGKGFPFAFSVYFKIRQTGRQLRPFMEKTNCFRVYSPGVGREEERPAQLLCLLPGKTPSAKTLSEEVRLAHLARLDLIIATGTAEGAKFYKISAYNF